MGFKEPSSLSTSAWFSQNRKTRFVEINIPVRAITASDAQNGSGVFELSFRDGRHLPFEGAGAISEWPLELFTDLPTNNPDPTNPDFGTPLRQFDYSTIADAVVHIKYTAREDAGAFKNSAIAHLRDYFSEDGTIRSWLALDLRRNFGAGWSRFVNQVNPANGNVFEFEMSTAFFPQALPPAGSNIMVLTMSHTYGDLHFGQKAIAAAGIEIVPTDEPVMWKVKVT